MSASRREATTDLLIAVLCAVAITAPLLVRGTPDEETYEFSTFSTLYFAKHLFTQPFFAPDFGFGIRIPNGQWFVRFPASLAALTGSARALYSSLWLFGQATFAFFILRLLRWMATPVMVRAAALVTAVLSFSNLAYFYVDDWPEVFLGWCLVPFCLWTAVTLFEARRAGEPHAGRMALCALAFGLLIGNGHPLHTFIWFTVLLFFFVPVVVARPSWTGMLAVVGLAAALGGLDLVTQTLEGIGSSQGTFNPLKDPTQYPTLGTADYLRFLHPLPAVLAHGWEGLMESAYGRRPFYGGAFLVLAVIGSAIALLRPHLVGRGLERSVVRALGVAFFGCLLLTLLPSRAVFNLVGEGWHYKDGQTVFAILVAALVLGMLHQRGWHKLVTTLVVVQVVQAGLVAAPVVRGVWRNDRDLLFGRDVNPDAFWKHPAVTALRGRSRVVVAGQLDRELFSNLRAADGVVASTDFVLEDIGIVNGWYRGTVTPRFAPTGDPRYGAYQTILRWDANLRRMDRAALDALGITHVLAFADDSRDIAATWGLDESARITVSGPRSPVVLLRNPRAWDRASLIGQARPGTLTQRLDCLEADLWCADFAPIANHRVPGTHLRRDRGRFIMDLPSRHPAGYAVLTQVLAQGWTARVDGASRDVHAFHDVFAAVDVREGDRTIEFTYDNREQALLMAAGYAQMIICLVVYAVASRRRESESAR